MKAFVSLFFAVVLLFRETHAFAASDVFKFIGDSVAAAPLGDLGSSLFGWALTAMGLGGGGSGLSGIANELDSVNNNIDEMAKELSILLKGIEKILNQGNCNQFVLEFENAKSFIDDYTGYYSTFVQEGKYGEAPPINCRTGTGANENEPSQCLSVWAADVLDNDTGAQHWITVIGNILSNTGGEAGAIIECPLTLLKPKQGDFEHEYYPQVQEFLDRMYDYQTRALLLLVEAYHFNAWILSGQPGGDPSDPASYTSICASPGNNSEVWTNCLNANRAVNTVYDNVLAQYKLIGAPVATNDSVVQYTADATVGGTSAQANMYPASLEKFTVAAGDTTCSTPLPSLDPCGPTTSTTFASVDYNGQSGWLPADNQDLTMLLTNKPGSVTPGQYLNMEGFEYMNDKIFLTEDRKSVSFVHHPLSPSTFSGTLRCFLDADAQDWPLPQPYCQDGSLVERVINYHCPGNLDLCGKAPTPGNNFYDFKATAIPGVFGTYGIEFSSYPGWTTNSDNEQYYLPRLYLESGGPAAGRVDFNCPAASHFNAGGAFSLCGSALEDYLNNFIPKPPAYTPPDSISEFVTKSKSGKAKKEGKAKKGKAKKGKTTD